MTHSNAPAGTARLDDGAAEIPHRRVWSRASGALAPAALAALMVQLAPAAGHAAGRLAPQDVAVLAATCFTCHGPDGRPPGHANDGIPGLRGRGAAYLLERLRAFKAQGHARADASATVMPLLMQGYDDAQIEALARWFADDGERP